MGKLSAMVAVVEDLAEQVGKPAFWNVLDAPLHAGGAPVLCGTVGNVDVTLDVGGWDARVWVKGRTWADGWPWVADVHGPDHLRGTLAAWWLRS